MELVDQAQDLLARLSAVPGQIAKLTAGWSERDLRTVPAGDEWSAAQILAHLRASDDILAYRAYAMLTRDDTPLLPVFDERRWAEVAGYEQMDFQSSLQAFSLRRAELVNMLRRIPLNDWERTAIREQIGPVTLLGGMTALVEHEEEHCLQLESIRRMRAAKR